MQNQTFSFQPHSIKILCLISITALFFLFSGIGCPIRWLTGISCPGCGITRAMLALLRLDFSAAFACHPLFWFLPPAFVYIIIGKHPLLGSDKNEKYFLIFVILITIAVYLFRLFFTENNIVFIDLHQGFMLKLLQF